MIELVNANSIAIPLASGSVDMIFADPPYLKQYVETYRYLADESARVLKTGGFVVAMCGESYLPRILSFFEAAGLTYYWLYTLGLSGRGASCWRSNGHRNMPIGTSVKHVLAYSKGRAVSRTATVGYFKGKARDKAFHEWGQDVESHRYYIDCFSAPGDLVVDPFCGGGTTGEACEVLGRRCLLMDIDGEALSVTKERLRL